MQSPIYTDVNELETYPTLETALFTCCPICGDKLEWSLKVIYDARLDCPVIEGHAVSCGVTFKLLTDVAYGYVFTYYIEMTIGDDE